MKWTESHIKALKREGKIKDYTISKRAANLPKIPSSDCKQVQWMHVELLKFQDETGKKLMKEFRFHYTRKWRFDFAFPEIFIAIEYDGLMSEKSGHTTLTGFTKDTEKINEAQRLGWRVLRYTVLNYKNVITDLKQILSIK